MLIIDTQQNSILKSLKAAKELYHQLVLVVGPSGSGKTKILKKIAEHERTSVINVNLKISSQLLELTGRQRKTQLQKIFSAIVDQAKAPVILDNIEILFDKNLEQDPLRLLQIASRNNLILVSWNGIVKDEKLLYAEINHPEYRTYALPDTIAISINKK